MEKLAGVQISGGCWRGAVPSVVDEKLTQNMLSMRKTHRLHWILLSSNFASDSIKLGSVKTAMDHKILSMAATVIQQKSSSTISCLVCQKALNYPTIFKQVQGTFACKRFRRDSVDNILFFNKNLLF